MFEIFFGIRQRLWLVGPISLLTFWGYSISMLIAKAHGRATGLYKWFLFVIKMLVGVPFMFMNATFNATCGSIIFLELPKWGRGEFFFTDRLKRQKTNKNPEYAFAANLLCSQLNKTDLDHC